MCTNTMGCIAHLIKALSGDLEKNPRPFTQIINAIIIHLRAEIRKYRESADRSEKTFFFFFHQKIPFG